MGSDSQCDPHGGKDTGSSHSKSPIDSACSSQDAPFSANDSKEENPTLNVNQKKRIRTEYQKAYRQKLKEKITPEIKMRIAANSKAYRERKKRLREEGILTEAQIATQTTAEHKLRKAANSKAYRERKKRLREDMLMEMTRELSVLDSQSYRERPCETVPLISETGTDDTNDSGSLEQGTNIDEPVSHIEEQRCRQWVRAAGRPDLETKDFKTLRNNNRICELHFVQSDIFSRKLTQNAVPSLNLPQRENNGDRLTKYTQTEAFFVKFKCQSCETVNDIPSTSKSNIILSPAVQELYANIHEKRKLCEQKPMKNKRVKLLNNQLKSSKVDASRFSAIIEKISYIQEHFKISFEGNQDNHEYKMFTMNMYFASPLAYRILAKTLYLPSEKNLRRTRIDVGTNLRQNVVRCLQLKVKHLSEFEKVCVLCASEVPLKRHLHYQINEDKIIGVHEINRIQDIEPATRAFVVMARGLFSKWKQPLTYCFLSQSDNYSELSDWLDDITVKVIDMGFNVVAFTSDQRINLSSIARERNLLVSKDNTFFYLNGKKIYFVYDVPQLLRQLRNKLMKYDFIYYDADRKQERASWDDIEKLYDIEKERSYQIAFKLTESHVRPNKYEKMKVKLAAQVFSRTVSTAIQTYVELKKLPEKATGTAKLLHLINNMFDILNSSSCNEACKYKISFSLQKYQMEVLQNVLQFLKTVRIVQKSNGKRVKNVKCLRSLETTIQSVINLYVDLNKQNFKFLFTRRLNMDVLEDFFSAVRRQGDSRFGRNPTPIQFTKAFRSLFMADLFQHFKNANCADSDLGKLLIATEDTNYLKSKESEIEHVYILTVGTVDYRFELPAENSFNYLCDYLLKKCYEVHNNCPRMEAYVDSKLEVNVIDNIVNVVSPHQNLRAYVREMDEVLMTIFAEGEALLPTQIGNDILRNVDYITFADKPCDCFPIGYLKKLFIRFRIFNIMTHNNRNFRAKPNQKIAFNVPDL